MEQDNLHYRNNTVNQFLTFAAERAVIIYGVGDEAGWALDLLSRRSVPVRYVVEAPFTLPGRALRGITIKPLEELLEEDKDAIVVLVTAHDVFRVEQQLLRMGIRAYFSSILFLERYFTFASNTTVRRIELQGD